MEARTPGPPRGNASALRRFRLNLSEALRHVLYNGRGDEDLARLARAGDTAAFDALATRYHDRIYTLAMHALGDEAGAGEAVCETFVSAFHDLSSVGTGCTTGAWLYLHGLRAVLGRLGAIPGQYSIHGCVLAEQPGRSSE